METRPEMILEIYNMLKEIILKMMVLHNAQYLGRLCEKVAYAGADSSKVSMCAENP